jgi:hypothetical protein
MPSGCSSLIATLDDFKALAKHQGGPLLTSWLSLVRTGREDQRAAILCDAGAFPIRLELAFNGSGKKHLLSSSLDEELDRMIISSSIVWRKNGSSNRYSVPTRRLIYPPGV